jgi:hypothetical protein
MSDKISTLLSQVATVVSVKTSALGMRQVDKEASRASDRAHNAMNGAAKVNVSRLAGAEDRVKEIISIQSDARAWAIDATTAWGDRRLLPNALLEYFMKGWGEAKSAFEEKVNAFVYDAPDLIARAENNKGTFNVSIPTVEEIRDAFKLEFQLEPVPDVSKYSSNIMDKALEAQMKERFEANIAAAYTEAQTDAVQRLAKPLQNLVERMTAYDQRELDKDKGMDVGRAGYFRDSVITNIQEIADVFGSWNLTGDPVIQKFDDALSAFGGIEAEDLRNNKDLRADVSKRAADILEQIKAGGYL